MTAPTVGVVGMKALLRDVAKLADDTKGPLYKAIQAAGKAAAEPVAAATRSALPHVSGRLAGDVRTSGTRSGAAVRYGRAKVPYAGWVEFGGHRSSPHDSDRAYDARGRYLFPAAQSLADRSARLYSDAITVVLNSASVWTNPGAEVGGVHD